MSAARHRARVVEHLGDTLLASPWLARLGRISFLGTLDHHPRSRRASNRLEHSLGVAKLAADAATALELPRGRARLFVAACLLHDVGHYPLSHAAEPAFAKVLGAGHHEVGRWIVLGDGPIPRLRSLRPLLESLHIDPAATWAIIDRSDTLAPDLRPLAELLKAPINLDTLEGIHRVARDFRLRRAKLPERIFTWVDGQLGIARPALPAIDRFWQLKDHVYDRVINLPSNILAEARLCELVAAKVDREIIDALDLFDDPALRRRLGHDALDRALLDGGEDGDYELWASETYGEVVGDQASPEGGERRPVLVRTRKRYFIDPSVEPEPRGLPLRAWSRRYRHERTRGWLVSRRQDQLSLPLPGLRPSESLRCDAPEI
ncbi:deoxyguanosinetriphosphate triphosphohydrolase-like protein [Enhygromyxa salina]|uniref:Deoxyguanosinetriphosphate triphosphohydrolase-like protein n=1 Tax=Enhygromyxa salina TaxID=215803 RepID=A0A2S9XAJ2_9BACT|nr:HD domain-containing protein [Enhygromyxa salina]PRP89873.1 deoxyguanosinetriphosphate triphosphohydrolase-like protein [Enhygromyxa salina]